MAVWNTLFERERERELVIKLIAMTAYLIPFANSRCLVAAMSQDTPWIAGGVRNWIIIVVTSGAPIFPNQAALTCV